MTKILYLDCSSGISGDMFLGSLIDCGLGLEYLRAELRKIKIGGYNLKSHKVNRGGIASVKFDVLCAKTPAGAHTERKTLKGIVNLIDSSGLAGEVKRKAISVFTYLADAEAKAHGHAKDEVHFHEVGDTDSIVDIVGASIALGKMGIDEIHSSAVALGCGRINVHGGSYPNPAPATAYLLEEAEITPSGIQYELVTPTGAAILKTFCKSFGEIPQMKILKIGYGAGSRDMPDHPNLLRSIIGERKPRAAGADIVTVIETNIDDMNPQLYEYLMERVLEAGALDIYLQPVIMKKSRPGCIVTVLTEPAKSGAIKKIIFEETTSFGVREHQATRQRLERKIVEVKTKYGKINVKLGYLESRLKVIAPEYEDCKRAAKIKGVSFSEVSAEAERAAKSKSK